MIDVSFPAFSRIVRVNCYGPVLFKGVVFAYVINSFCGKESKYCCILYNYLFILVTTFTVKNF